jgi:UDPglucose 6-dehydrogenase
MKISIIGTGYVGLVAGACFADLGNKVVCVDIDSAKIKSLQNGIMPIFEPGLEEIVKRNVSENRLSFTTNLAEAVKKSEIVFIAVGTPEKEDGSVDMTYVLKAAEEIGKAAAGPLIVVDKSTVPVGTSIQVEQIIRKNTKHKISVVSNPEFLREGSAINDFFKPDRIVIGSKDENAAKTISELYKPLDTEIIITTPESAELIKYASNSFLATKISFINEIAAICEKVGADVTEVAKGMGLDKRIGKHFLNAGAGYGGSCFPKDVSALKKTAEKLGYKFRILEAVEEVNERQKKLPVKKLKKELPDLKGKKIAVFGLAFKPNTDDMREASSVEIIKSLFSENAEIVAVDPVAENNAKKIFNNMKITFSKDPYMAAENSHAIILVTEWREFLELDYKKISQKMKSKIIIDARNVLDKEKLKSLGFTYIGVGR